MLPNNRYYRFNAPDIGAIQLDETDKQQLEILQNKVVCVCVCVCMRLSVFMCIHIPRALV